MADHSLRTVEDRRDRRQQLQDRASDEFLRRSERRRERHRSKYPIAASPTISSSPIWGTCGWRPMS